MTQNYQDLGLVAGAKLKQLIKESNHKTQEEFAFNFGVDVRTVRRWLKDGIDSLSTISQIAEFFDIAVSDILPI